MRFYRLFHSLIFIICLLDLVSAGENDAEEIDLQSIIDENTNDELVLAPGNYFAAETVNITSEKSLLIGPDTKISFAVEAGMNIEKGGNLNINCSAELPCHFENIEILSTTNGTISINHLLITNSTAGLDLVIDQDLDIQHLTIKDSAGIKVLNPNKDGIVKFQNLQMLNMRRTELIFFKEEEEYGSEHRADVIVRDSLFEDIQDGIGNYKRYRGFSLEATNSTFTQTPDGDRFYGRAIYVFNRRVNITGNRFNNFTRTTIEIRLRTYGFDPVPEASHEMKYLTIENNGFNDCTEAIEFEIDPPHELVIRKNRFSGLNSRRQEEQIKSIYVSSRVDRAPRRIDISENVFDSIGDSAVKLMFNVMNATELQINLNQVLNVNKMNADLIWIYLEVSERNGEDAIPKMVKLTSNYNVFVNNTVSTAYWVYRDDSSKYKENDNFQANVTYNHFLDNHFNESTVHARDLKFRFEYNNFHAIKGGYLMRLLSKSFAAQRNWWGSGDRDEIESRFYVQQYYDDMKPLITYLPFCKGDGSEYCKNLDDCVQMAKAQSQGQEFPCDTKETGFFNWIDEIVDGIV